MNESQLNNLIRIMPAFGAWPIAKQWANDGISELIFTIILAIIGLLVGTIIANQVQFKSRRYKWFTLLAIFIATIFLIPIVKLSDTF